MTRERYKRAECWSNDRQRGEGRSNCPMCHKRTVRKSNLFLWYERRLCQKFKTNDLCSGVFETKWLITSRVLTCKFLCGSEIYYASVTPADTVRISQLLSRRDPQRCSATLCPVVAHSLQSQHGLSSPECFIVCTDAVSRGLDSDQPPGRPALSLPVRGLQRP
jgi:hypothetical protein